MRQLQDPEIAKALATLDPLEADHHKANTLHAEVDALALNVWINAVFPLRKPTSFGRPSANWPFYGEHIRIEDELVFPAAKRMLSVTDRAAIALEIASRRDTPM